MTTYVMLYDGFANFEVVLAMYLLRTGMEVKTLGLTRETLRSIEGLTVVPDMLASEVKILEEDVLIIPGGDPAVLEGNEAFYDLIRQGDEVNTLLAAICSGTVHLARAGALKDREYTTSLSRTEDSPFDPDLYVKKNVVVDGHIVTAQPSGYAEFAITLGQLMDIYKDEEDMDETVNFFMNFEIQD